MKREKFEIQKIIEKDKRKIKTRKRKVIQKNVKVKVQK